MVRCSVAALIASALWVAAGQSVAAQSEAARGESATGWAPLTFSKLVLRVPKRHEIRISDAQMRVFILERLRASSLNVVGAENLVFDKDESAKAAFVLGGTVRELMCRSRGSGKPSCRIGIMWEVLDVRRDRVVYSVLTRRVLHDIERTDDGRAAQVLVGGALDSLIRREGFRRKLWRSAGHNPERPLAEAVFSRCDGAERVLPRDLPKVMPATAFIKTEQGFGSGFFLSPDGLVITAAHVVADQRAQYTVTTNQRANYLARIVRVEPELDVALLSVAAQSSDARFTCLPIAGDPKPIGSGVYAIGAPASQDLAFSVTRGIISGMRSLDGRALLQTDASVSPGNSGGPLTDDEGKVVGVVVEKFAGRGVEGVAFAVPVADVLAALALRPGARTDGTLHEAMTVVAAANEPEPDTPDAVPSLEPIAPLKTAAASEGGGLPERHPRRRGTPAAISVMRWGGLALTVAGLTTAIVSYASFDSDRPRRDDYEELRLVNDIGWAALGIGAVGFGLSFIAAPGSTDADQASATRLWLTPYGAALHGRY